MLQMLVCIYVCVCIRVYGLSQSEARVGSRSNIKSYLAPLYPEVAFSLSSSFSPNQPFRLFLAASNYPRQPPMLPTISPLFRLTLLQLVTLMVAGLFSIGETTHIEYRIHKSTDLLLLSSSTDQPHPHPLSVSYTTPPPKRSTSCTPLAFARVPSFDRWTLIAATVPLPLLSHPPGTVIKRRKDADGADVGSSMEDIQSRNPRPTRTVFRFHCRDPLDLPLSFLFFEMFSRIFFS